MKLKLSKKKVPNEIYRHAIQIRKIFEDTPTCPEIQTIERLLKDNGNNVDKVVSILTGDDDDKEPAARLTSTQATSSRHRDDQAASSIFMERVIPYEEEFNAFVSLMSDMLSKEQMIEIWMTAYDSPRHLSYKDTLMTADRLLLAAVDLVFKNMSSESDFSDDLSVCEVQGTDDRTVQDVVREMLYEDFNARDDDKLQAFIDCVLIECEYDFKEASSRILESLTPNPQSIIDVSFPSLQDAAIINQLVGDRAYPSYGSNAESGYKSAVVQSKSSSAVASSRSSTLNVSPAESLSMKTTQVPIPKQPYNICKAKIVVEPIIVSGSNEKAVNLHEHRRWRRVAADERKKMITKFAQAASSYSRRHSLSGYISDCGRDHQRNVMNANLQAALCALQANNPHLSFKLDSASTKLTFNGVSHSSSGWSSRMPLSIDLHLLTVTESIQVIDAVRFWFQQQVDNPGKVVLIVGQGKHSSNGMPVLGPALLKYLQSMNHPSTYVDGAITAKLC